MKTFDFLKNVSVAAFAMVSMSFTTAKAQEGPLAVESTTNICNTVHCQDVVVRRGATLEVAPDARLIIHGSLVVEDGARVSNMGQLQVDSAVTNRGTVYNFGTLASGTSITNMGAYFNNGLTQARQAMRNYWVMENFGQMTLTEWVDRF